MKTVIEVLGKYCRLSGGEIEVSVSCFLLFSSFLDIEKLTLIMPNNNSIMMWQYIARNIRQMSPMYHPMNVSTRIDTPIMHVFSSNDNDQDDDNATTILNSVKRFLKDHSIKIISCCNEDEMGVFIEFDDLENLINFYHELKKQKMFVPLANNEERLKLEVEVSYLPLPSC